MYDIEFSSSALRDLQYFNKREQNIILNTIEKQLRFEPTVETRNRFRREPPDIAEWELRIGVFRAYYNVEEVVRIVSLERIGYKPNNIVFFRGRRSGQS